MIDKGDAAQVVIELSRRGPVPEGRVSGPAGTCTGFEGWLQLLSALEAIIDGEPHTHTSQCGRESSANERDAVFAARTSSNKGERIQRYSRRSQPLPRDDQRRRRGK
jgi:hypothetical protein